MTAASYKGLALTSCLWLALAVILGSCRDRVPPARTIDWQTTIPETAALLLVNHQGDTTLMCLPGPGASRPLFSGTAPWRLLDATWANGPVLVGLTDESNELVLLAANAEPRRLGQGVRSARFSPDGSALVYEVRQDDPNSPTSYVLDLATGKVTKIAALAEPRWEADGKHLRATLIRKEPDGRQRWLRARWDRQSESIALLGPGSTQIPAPQGAAVAWSQDQESPSPRSYCMVRLGPPGANQLPHKIQGDFCLGVADDRGVRWSPDGRWLAFPHPGPVPGGQDPDKSFLDVVAIAGGRSPTLMSLHTQVGPAASEIAVAPASVWHDWSPSQRFLAIADGAGDLRIYDFEAQGIAVLGKGKRPQWSPGGGYLLIEAGNGADTAPHILVLPSAIPSARIDLGPARDARWLPAQACASESGAGR